MHTYIALLRGINVSGHRLIKMADLKAMCDGLGLAKVQTYIQSGNLLFQSAEGAELLRPRLEREIERVFGFDVPVALLTLAELEQIVADCPYPPDRLAEGEYLYVAFLTQPPPQTGIDRLLAHPAGSEELRLSGRAVYLLYRQPVHKSKLTNNLLEKKLGVPATTRNWQTTTKLAELGRALS